MKALPTTTNQPSSSTKQKAPGDKPNWVKQVEWFCVFTVLFIGYLYTSGPVKTASQGYFRMGLLTVGVVGYVAMQVLNWRRTRNAGSS